MYRHFHSETVCRTVATGAFNEIRTRRWRDPFVRMTIHAERGTETSPGRVCIVADGAELPPDFRTAVSGAVPVVGEDRHVATWIRDWIAAAPFLPTDEAALASLAARLAPVLS